MPDDELMELVEQGEVDLREGWDVSGVSSTAVRSLALRCLFSRRIMNCGTIFWKLSKRQSVGRRPSLCGKQTPTSTQKTTMDPSQKFTVRKTAKTQTKLCSALYRVTHSVAAGFCNCVDSRESRSVAMLKRSSNIVNCSCVVVTSPPRASRNSTMLGCKLSRHSVVPLVSKCTSC